MRRSRALRWLRMSSGRLTLGLRARSTVGFAVVTAAVVGVLAVVSYERIADDVLSEREDVALRQAYANARIVRARVRVPSPDPGAVIASLESRQGTPLLRFGGEWFTAGVDARRSDIPARLLEAVDAGHVAFQRVRVDGELTAVAGIPVIAVNAAYIEFVHLGEVEATLTAVRRSLALGAGVAAVMGGVLGAFASGAALRPLRRVAEAASTVRQGRLSARVARTGDGDLDPLVDAFNDMIAELRARIDRDERFASNVSHELRGPLAALAAAAEHAHRHADDPAQVRDALAVLSRTVADFNRLVVDLLDISRMEAGVATLTPEPTVLAALLDAAVADRHVEIRFGTGVPEVVVLDKRRVGQSLTNLLENADRYGGGATAVSAEARDGRLLLFVDDKGPGVPEHERSFIFERFARGAGAEDVQGGTGLGLALVAEHVRLHGGDVSVTDAPGGGARFVVDLPLQEYTS